MMYEISEASIQLIEGQASFLSCTCINGGKKDHGRWQAVKIKSNLDKNVINEHHVSSLFLNECARNLYHKNNLKQQPTRAKDKINTKQAENNFIHQFTHEPSSRDHIANYRNKKSLSSNAKKDETEKCEDPQISGWASKEITMISVDGACNHTNNNFLASFRRTPMATQRITSGYYTGPYYPPLYGQVQSPFCPDINKTLLESHKVFPIRPEIDEQSNHWVPENAVFQFRQPSPKSYNSVCCYECDTISYQGLQRGYLNAAISPNITPESIVAEKKASIPAITNLRTRSGRPIALVKCTNGDEQVEQNDANLSYGKLLQGRLKFPSLSDHAMQSNALVVHSKSPFRQSEPAIEQPSSEHKPLYLPMKQESVNSIPSSKTNLPNLEVRPSSSIPSSYWDPLYAEDKKFSKQKSNSSDIMLESPVVMNKSLQSKIQNSERLVRAISAKARKGSQNAYFNSILSQAGTKELLNFPTTRKLQNRDFILKSFQKIPKRHILINLRNLSGNRTEVPNNTTIEDNKDTSECALRVQQRRKRHRRKITRTSSKNMEPSKCACVKNPIPKVFVKGSAKTLVDFPPNPSNDARKLTELYAE